MKTHYIIYQLSVYVGEDDTTKEDIYQPQPPWWMGASAAPPYGERLVINRQEQA